MKLLINRIVFKIYDLAQKTVSEVTTKETEVKFHVEEIKYLGTELIGDIVRWSFYLNIC